MNTVITSEINSAEADVRSSIHSSALDFFLLAVVFNFMLRS